MLHRSLIAAGAALAFVVSPALAEKHDMPGHDAQIPGLTKDLSKAKSGSYELDSTHANVTWKLSHMGLSYYYGRFDSAAGTLEFDASAPEKSKLSVTIKSDSVNVQSDHLQKKLIGEEGFNAAKHPEITFVSKKIEKTGDDTGIVTGDLTMLGVTKEVELDVMFNGTAVHPFKKKRALGFDAYGSFNRSEFGLKSWLPGVGDGVQLAIEGEFHLKD